MGGSIFETHLFNQMQGGGSRMFNKVSVVLLVVLVVFSIGSFIAHSPAADAAAAIYTCATLDGQSGGGPDATYLYWTGDFKAGDQLAVDVTFAGASEVTLEVPNDTVVDSLTSHGQLNYTFPADVIVTFHVSSLHNGDHGFYYVLSCSSAGEDVDGAGSDLRTGPDMVTIPSHAVVGTFLTATPLRSYPGGDPSAEFVMEPGQTLWVFGMDSTGMYYQVLLSGRFFWVPVSSMGPNYDENWNGTPLPTTVVD